MRLGKEQLSELEIYWPVGKTWCHRTILPLLRTEKGLCYIHFTFMSAIAITSKTWAIRKMLPFKTSSAFHGAGSQEKMRTPCNVLNKTQRKVFSGTAGHQGAVSASHTIFTFAHLPSFAEPHDGGQLHEPWLGNWNLVLQSHTPISPIEPVNKQFGTEWGYRAL